MDVSRFECLNALGDELLASIQVRIEVLNGFTCGNGARRTQGVRTPYTIAHRSGHRARQFAFTANAEVDGSRRNKILLFKIFTHHLRINQ